MNDFVENFKKLNDKQQAALSLLLVGDNNKVVASKIGVDENTIYRWRTDPVFKQLLIDLRIQALQSIEIKLHTLGDKALNNLLSILDNAKTENNQLKASIFIIDKILQLNQLELIKRLNFIEERLNLK